MSDDNDDNRNIPSAQDFLTEEEYIELLYEEGAITKEERNVLLKAVEERKKERQKIEIPF